MSKYQWQVIGALVVLMALALTQRLWGQWITDFWRGVYVGMFSVFLIMRTKQRVLERALAEARKGRCDTAPV
jgi:hypothetical protein